MVELKLNLKQITEKFLNTNDIRIEILEIFTSEEINKSSVDEGQAYITAEIGVKENPAIYDLTSYIMKANYIEKIKIDDEFFFTDIDILEVSTENSSISVRVVDINTDNSI